MGNLINQYSDYWLRMKVINLQLAAEPVLNGRESREFLARFQTLKNILFPSEVSMPFEIQSNEGFGVAMAVLYRQLLELARNARIEAKGLAQFRRVQPNYALVDYLIDYVNQLTRRAQYLQQA